MRSVAPERPGSAASQNSWSVVNAEADRRQLGDDDRPHHPDREGQQQAGIEIQRLRRAIARPVRLPELRVLGPPVLVSTVAGQRADVRRLVDRLHLGQFGQLLPAPRRRRRAPSAGWRHASRPARPATSRNSSMKQLGPDPGQIVRARRRRSAARSRRGRRSCRPGRRRRRHGSGSRPGCACRRRPCRGS